jgi:hypothetical protein
VGACAATVAIVPFMPLPGPRDDRVDSDIPASLTAFGAPPRRASVTVAHPSPGQRAVRGLKAGGIFWAVAAGCVFLPGLHFVLVPGFLLIGVVVGFRHLRDQEIVSRVHGACPRCGIEQDLAAGNRLTPSWTLDCPVCHNHLTLTLDPGEN